VRKFAAVFLFATLGLAVPMSAAAQNQSDDAARIASQKHNAKRSQKAAKAQKHAMKKAIKAAGKPKKPRKMTYQTLN
jgi:Flp pilus assembly protein TadG